MKPQRPEIPENSVEYIVGEDGIDMVTDCDKMDDSSSSESDNEDRMPSKPTKLRLDDPESDGGSNSSSTDYSSDSSNHSKKKLVTLPSANSSMCTACGRGPFRSMKLHLLHCSGVKVKYQCSLCKKLFPTEAALNEHYMPLYSCDVCGQVFSHETAYHHHPCPKSGESPLVCFCSETMPKVCNICKSFFESEKTLLNHVTMVHTSVVSTKVCIITNPSALTDKKVSQCVRSTAVQSAINQNVVDQLSNGKLCVGQSYAGSLSNLVQSSPSSLSTSSSCHPGKTPTSINMASPAPVSLDNDDQWTNQPPTPLFVFSGVSSADSEASTPAPAIPPPVPTILAMFENDSQDMALMKRMNTGWRSKVPRPCRQCGAILRQPSLIISHRYLHRGRRSHRCQCGRAFKHRLHLLRHCVQHAEAINYICVSCGETFIGAKLLAEHMKGKSEEKLGPSGSKQRQRGKLKRKCRMPFTCDCGQLFFRPSAFIWHQLQNLKTKQLKNSLK